jgi:putative aldouronate transport system substrate-binding protein
VSTNRRTFLGLVGMGAATVAGGPLLSGCSREPGSTGTATNADAASAVVPDFKPVQLVQPDIKGVPPVVDGYVNYPKSTVAAITEKPGTSGQAIKATTPWWGPPPPATGQNAYVDAVNTALGVPVEFSVQDGNTYSEKVNAMVGARDVPDLLVIPGWDIGRIARFSEGSHVLFEDLTPYLAKEKGANYPMLAGLPTAAWKDSVWGGKLMGVPFPTDNPFPWALFHRKDLAEAAGLADPTNLDELYAYGRKLTDPGRGVWAFGDISAEVEQALGAPGSQQGWRKNADGTLTHKYETPEYKQAVEYMIKVFKDGLMHPELAGSKGGDANALLRAGKVVCWQGGLGVWRGMQRDETRNNPKFNLQPIKVFGAAPGQKPVRWQGTPGIIWTFIKKDLGQARVEELLRVLNWNAAPFGTKEYELREYGVEGTHFTRAADGTPVTNDLYTKEFANQFGFLGGRPAVIVGGADVPHYAQDMLAWCNDAIQYAEPDPWTGIKVETPTKIATIAQPTEDKLTDIKRGRRPLSDLEAVVTEWRNTGGDEAREFYAKVLADNGR